MITKKHLAMEGDFIETRDGLIFDVKGYLHPVDKIIAFIRYVPFLFFINRFKGFQDIKKNLITLVEKGNLSKLLTEINKNLSFTIDDIRIRNKDQVYLKVYELNSRYKILTQISPDYIFHHPNYDIPLQAVPVKDIACHYRPEECLKNIINNKNQIPEQYNALKSLIDIFCEGGKISKENIGISGSEMVSLARKDGKKSDFDIIIYGEKEGRRIHSFLKTFLDRKKEFPIIEKELKIKLYDKNSLKKHFLFRAKGSNISFKRFYRYERRKLHQFFINNTEVFIRFLKYRREENPQCDQFENKKFQSVGRISLKGKIINDDENFFTPAIYCAQPIKIFEITSETNDLKYRESLKEQLKNNKIEIFSYRGRFTEQAKIKEKFFLSGKLEHVIMLSSTRKQDQNYFRIILGDIDDQFYLI